VELELEAKLFTHEDLEALADVVTAVGVLMRVEFTSSNSPMLMALKRLVPAARIGIFSPRRQDWMVDDEIFESFIVSRAEFAEADVVHVHADDIIPAVADRLHANGQVVHANDASTADAITRAFRCGADRTTTDDPRMALAAIEVAASAKERPRAAPDAPL
jgi:glycerophosphoryl diester phosphodiesterase